MVAVASDPTGNLESPCLISVGFKSVVIKSGGGWWGMQTRTGSEYRLPCVGRDIGISANLLEVALSHPHRDHQKERWAREEEVERQKRITHV